MGELKVLLESEQAGSLLDPVRIRILSALGDPDSATGLAKKLDLPRQKVNYHLRELEKANLVELVEERKKRNCTERVLRATATHYLISPAVTGSLAADPDAIQEKFSASYLVAVAARMIRELAVLIERAGKAKKKLPTYTMQTDVRFATADDLLAFTEEVTNTISKLAAKYHDEKAPNGRTYRYVLASYPAITKLEDEFMDKENAEPERPEEETR